MRKALTLIFLIFGLSIYSQEERKSTIDLQGLYLKKGNANFTYFGLGVTKDAKRKNFSNSILLDMHYDDFNYSYGYHFFFAKLVLSKNYTLTKKWFFTSFGLGGGLFNYKSSDFSLQTINTGFGACLVPNISFGAKYKKLKLGIGSNSAFIIGQQRTQSGFYNGTDFLLDNVTYFFVQLSIEL